MSEEEKQDKKIVTDDNWKDQARKEKEKLTEKEQKVEAGSGGGGDAMPPASFATLVNSLAIQAMFCMGKLADPGQEKVQVNLDLAKHHIDLLEIIEEKTKGNLTDEETKTISMTLHEMRMLYVETAQMG